MRKAVHLFAVLILAVAAQAVPVDDLIASFPTLEQRKASARTYVYDRTGLMESNDVVAINGAVVAVESSSGAEIACVLLKSLQGGEVSDFANKLFARMKLGKTGRDNGALIVVSVEDRKTWVEVGYGLEPIIPDGKAGRIIDEVIVPRLKEGRFSAAMRAGAEAIMGIIAGDAASSGSPIAGATSAAGGEKPKSSPIGFIIIFAVFIGIVAFFRFAAKKGWVKPGPPSGPQSGPPGPGIPPAAGQSGGQPSRAPPSFGGGRSGGGGAGRSW